MPVDPYPHETALKPQQKPSKEIKKKRNKMKNRSKENSNMIVIISMRLKGREINL